MQGVGHYPLALTVMGGLMSSAVLTLVVLPYINLGVEGVASWLRTLWSTSRVRARPAAPVEVVEVAS